MPATHASLDPATVIQPRRAPSWLDPNAAAAHLPRLRGLARTLCGSRHLADDLTQETFVRVLARPRRLRADDPYPYLVRTLRNVIADHWRTQRRHSTLVDMSECRDGDPEVAVLAGEVVAAVADLPEHLRHVVAAVDVAGMTYAEAAETLRIPPGTVMSRLHRGRTRVTGALAA